MRRGKRQRTLLPVQSAGEIQQRNGSVVNFNVNIVQAEMAQRNRIRRADLA